ncbi:MAG TPA: hypothetical protein VF719_04600 [Abditibacteriaceae bacterium]|jgi:hypothetical protein
MKIMNKNRYVALGTLGVMTLGITVATPTPAQASSSTWKKLAIGAGIVTGYGLVKGKGKVATIGGLATAGSYYMYSRDKKKEEEQARLERRYNRRYNRAYR